MSALRTRTQEINAEYWAVRETLTERVAVAQLCMALARTELVASERVSEPKTADRSVTVSAREKTREGAR